MSQQGPTSLSLWVTATRSTSGSKRAMLRLSLSLRCLLALPRVHADQLQLSNETDSGGDSCSYYEDHRHHCGCCDTPDFSSSDCLACQSPLRIGNSKGWTWVLQTWPRKARTLRLPGRGIKESIPADLAERWPGLEHIDLSDNFLVGELPRQLGDLSGLVSLQLSGNQLSGRLPPELGSLSLTRLDLRRNQLSGDLPPELGSLRNLTTLYLSFNRLSGSLPRELGNLRHLEYFDLADNQLSGTVPGELGNLLRLSQLSLSNNQLSGRIPLDLGKLLSLRTLGLDNNQLTGSLPRELGNLTSLRFLELHSNQLSGSLPSELGNMRRMVMLRLENNQFSGSLPPELGNMGSQGSFHYLFLNDNQLSGSVPPVLGNLGWLFQLRLHNNLLSGGLPSELGSLMRLTELRLENNRLSGSIPPELGNLASLIWLNMRGNQLDGRPPELGRLQRLRYLDLSANQLSGDICSLLVAVGLRELFLQENRFRGDLPLELAAMRDLEVLNLSANQLSGSLTPEHLSGTEFALEASRLTSLDLSWNRITAVLALPPPRLVWANLRGNALTSLNAGWWSRRTQCGAFLEVDARDNPDLRLPVRFDDGICPSEGLLVELRAHARDWHKRPGTASECTSLCPLENSRLLVDGTVNESQLCRCTQGQGLGLNCSPCSSNAYSSLTWNKRDRHFHRECLECPANSILPSGHVDCFADCHCTAGHYMVQMWNGSAQDVGTTPCEHLPQESEGKCLPCELFKTSQRGSRSRADCQCNGNVSNGGWAKLLERDGRCGCPEGSHMNFVERSCVPCHPEEECADWTRSLVPPQIKAGFWAVAPPPKGSDGTFGNFSRHSIWRCQSTSACPGNFSCGLNRAGTACSLCRRGHFATFSGRCAPCPLSYTDTRRLLAASLLACTPLPILTLFQLKVNAGESSRLALALKPVLKSMKQLLNFAQILGLLFLFHVEWPPVAKSTFGVVAQMFSVDLAAFVGVACLDAQQQQSVTLELAFRWMLPLAGVAITCFAALLVTVCGRIFGALSKARLERLLSVRPVDVLQVLLFFLHLFFPTFLKNALLPLTCSPSPNGLLTMNAFPHQVCWSAGAESDASFWSAAGVGLAQSAFLSLGFPLLLFFARKRVEASRTSAVLRQRRRWWAFLFQDFRPHRTSWALVAVCKDILLNLVVLLPGLGTAQLLVTAVVSIAHACWAFRASPYPAASNSLLETCLSAAVASMCLFSAGVGFQSESDVPDVGAYVAEGREGPSYRRRAIMLVCLQGLSLLAPMAIVTLQLLVAFPRSRRCVPDFLRPVDSEGRSGWSQDFTRAMGLGGGPLPRALVEFDNVEFSTFQRAVLDAPVVQGALAIVNRSNTKEDLAALVPQLRADLIASQTKTATLKAKTATLEAENAALQEEIQGLQADVHRSRQQEEELHEQLRQRVMSKYIMSL